MKVTDEKEPDPEPDPNPLVRGTDPTPRIRIRTKMSRIRYPGENNSFTTAHFQTLLYVVTFHLSILLTCAQIFIRLSKTNVNFWLQLYARIVRHDAIFMLGSHLYKVLLAEPVEVTRIVAGEGFHVLSVPANTQPNWIFFRLTEKLLRLYEPT